MLSFLLLFFLANPITHAKVSERAHVCLNKLFQAYAPIREYSVMLDQIERSPRGRQVSHQKLQLTHTKPNRIVARFMDKGQSGVKNNGMIAEYDGSRNLKIHLGEAHGLGIFMNRAARAVIGDSLDLYSSRVTDKEYFTLNHTSFTFLIAMLQKNLPGAEASLNGGIDAAPGDDCKLIYTPHAQAVDRKFKDLDELARAEEDLGSMTIFWVFLNLDRFEDLSDFYSGFAGRKVRVSSSALPFELDLNKDNLPRLLKFSYEGEEVASYRYEYLSIVK